MDEKVKENIAEHIKPIMIKMLNLIRDTENDDVSNVIQRLIYVYEDEISTFAVEIMQHLVSYSKITYYRINIKKIAEIFQFF